MTTTTGTQSDNGAEEPLRRNRDFWVVLVGQGVSSFGDAITNTALPLLVLGITGSGFVMGMVNVLSTLPDLLVGLFAGAYADRWDRRRMMFFADLGRAVLTALIPISIWLDGPTIPLILLVTFPMNVLRVLWLAAYTASVPGLVGRGQVARASAIFEAVFNVGWIVGPAIAGLLAATIGPGPDDRARRAHVPRLGRSRSCSSDGRCAPSAASRRTSSSTSGRASGSSPTSRRCAPCSRCGRRRRSSPPG